MKTKTLKRIKEEFEDELYCVENLDGEGRHKINRFFVKIMGEIEDFLESIPGEDIMVLDEDDGLPEGVYKDKNGQYVNERDVLQIWGQNSEKERIRQLIAVVKGE